MKMPTQNWMPISDWAVLNGWDQARARIEALGHVEIDYAADQVRYIPDTRKPPKFVKISKSDQL